MGAWIEMQNGDRKYNAQDVAPLVGAWIEIRNCYRPWHCRRWSLPSWERGLKYADMEIKHLSRSVAPLVGAWIEIFHKEGKSWNKKSLPSWERGLKWDSEVQKLAGICRSPRGSVD